MITSNVIHRVFHIRYRGSSGTAFAIDVDHRQYLVTAKHVVERIQGADSLEVMMNGAWQALAVRLVGHAAQDVDISVLACERCLTPPNLPLPVGCAGVVYGQDVYFLGFPYGFVGRIVLGADGFHLPFVKRATVSLFDGPIFYLDGHNNPGFSGGPVVFRRAPGAQLEVAAVISGFRAVEEPILGANQAIPPRYIYNTGIIVAHAVDACLGLIAANPVGPALDA